MDSHLLQGLLCPTDGTHLTPHLPLLLISQDVLQWPRIGTAVPRPGDLHMSPVGGSASGSWGLIGCPFKAHIYKDAHLCCCGLVTPLDVQLQDGKTARMREGWSDGGRDPDGGSVPLQSATCYSPAPYRLSSPPSERHPAHHSGSDPGEQEEVVSHLASRAILLTSPHPPHLTCQLTLAFVN